MATRKKTNGTAGAKASAETEIKTPAETLGDELVAEASIEATLENDQEEVKEEPKKAPKSTKSYDYYSDTITIMNTCYNEIFLNGGKPELCVRIAPKEVKSISRSLYRELIKNQVVRNWFDKGIIATSKDANETTAHEAKIPENLKNPVERTDAVSTVSASVTKFEKDGAVQIKL